MLTLNTVAEIKRLMHFFLNMFLLPASIHRSVTTALNTQKVAITTNF